MSFDYITRNPLEDPERKHGPLDLDSMQEIVQGSFQIVHGDAVGLPEYVDVYMNEEGKIFGLLPNLRIVYDAIDGPEVDLFVGTIIIKAATEQGANRSMTEEEMLAAEEWLKERMLWL